MQNTWFQPNMPLQHGRPHTVHASTAPYMNAAQKQHHARESWAQLGVLPEAQNERRLSRDDTANSVSELIPPAAAPTLYGSELNPASEDCLINSQSLPEDIRPSTSRTLRAPSKSFRFASFTAGSDSSAAVPSQSTTSLGRRISRTKEKMQVIRENVPGSRVWPRMRRQSTPQGIDSSSHSREIVPVPPTSPSKRNGKHEGDRPAKQHRYFFKSTGEIRKDTPAPPPACGGALSRPAARQAMQSFVLPQGGEGARQAAAAFSKVNTSQQAPAWSGQADLNARRERVGSLSSAADSGADLSSYSGSNASCKDLDGDVEMTTDEQPQPSPKQLDPLTVLPAELALKIFEQLDAPDLANIETVNKTWKKHASEGSVWQCAYLRKYHRRIYTDPPSIQVGGVGCGRPFSKKQEWKRMYKARKALDKNWRAGPKEAGKAIYLSGHTDSVYCVQFDEEKIITGSRDRTIRVWDINNFTCQRVIGGPNAKPPAGPKVLRTVDYPDFHLATASVNGTAYGNSIFQTPSQWHDASILCLQYDEEILVTGSSDSTLLVWDINDYEPIKRLRRHSGGVLDVALDGKHIVSCSKDSRIIVWDRKTLEYKGELTGHRGPVNAVQLRGKFLVSASGDGIARLWDIEAMKLVKEFSAKERGLAAVEFSEDMKYVLAGGNDTITYKFEVETGKEVKQFTGHSQLVRSLWLDSQNNRVVSGSYDLDLRVYDFETGEQIWRAGEWTTSWMLAAKSDYRRIVATSQDGRILIIDFGLQKCRTVDDGQPIPGVDLLRGLEHTSIIEWVDPWERDQEKARERERNRLRIEATRSFDNSNGQE